MCIEKNAVKEISFWHLKINEKKVSAFCILTGFFSISWPFQKHIKQ